MHENYKTLLNLSVSKSPQIARHFLRCFLSTILTNQRKNQQKHVKNPNNKNRQIQITTTTLIQLPSKNQPKMD